MLAGGEHERTHVAVGGAERRVQAMSCEGCLDDRPLRADRHVGQAHWAVGLGRNLEQIVDLSLRGVVRRG